MQSYGVYFWGRLDCIVTVSISGEVSNLRYLFLRKVRMEIFRVMSRSGGGVSVCVCVWCERDMTVGMTKIEDIEGFL